MNKIYKYHIPETGKFKLALPKGAKILAVRVLDNEPYMWAKISDGITAFEERTFQYVGTGMSFDDNGGSWQYIDSFITRGSEGQHYVLHLFER